MATRTAAAPPLAPTPESPVPAPAEAAAQAEESAEQTHLEDGKRRMPDKLKRYLLRVQGGKFYLPAAYRIVWFRDECPDWGVATELIEGGQEAGFATVKATVYNPEGRIISTGHKTETRQDFPAGWVEKAETGSVARALALAGFGTQFSPELDEAEFADSPQPIYNMPRSPALSTVPAPRVRVGAGMALQGSRVRSAGEPSHSGDEVWEGPGQCPRCHAPAGKRHGKPCVA